MVKGDEMVLNIRHRGIFVDAEEVTQGLASSAKKLSQAPGTFSDQWSSMQATMGDLLKHPGAPQFLERVGEVSALIESKVDKQTDQLIFSILSQGHHKLGAYGVNHSLHVASVCSILARRANWSLERRRSVTAAALTMNLAMIELQGRLALVKGRPSDEQQVVIHNHPLASARMLREMDLVDKEWLTAVEQHHEQPDGKGYPHGVTDPSEMSQMLRLVDVFLAKHSPRAGRESVPAKQAAQSVYLQSNGHPLASLLVKEIGIYPPGCFVKLACGEVAVVLRRGTNANAPLVASLVNQKGDPLGTSVIRDTTMAKFIIVETVPSKSVLVNFSVDHLYAATQGQVRPS